MKYRTDLSVIEIEVEIVCETMKTVCKLELRVDKEWVKVEVSVQLAKKWR